MDRILSSVWPLEFFNTSSIVYTVHNRIFVPVPVVVFPEGFYPFVPEASFTASAGTFSTQYGVFKVFALIHIIYVFRFLCLFLPNTYY